MLELFWENIHLIPKHEWRVGLTCQRSGAQDQWCFLRTVQTILVLQNVLSCFGFYKLLPSGLFRNRIIALTSHFEGEESLEDQPRTGRPKEADRQNVLEATEEDPSLTTRSFISSTARNRNSIARGIDLLQEK
ncbi:hypothetical protein KIN20_001599 [Parelaphostrongylus tenuis]|uniref:Uncharacterized protein n=1 Tax=Parelaphostrongylus tenuis TaxID=148309 RepID=A0AAD5LUB2_PARTN|nr:hypothetical protein KIN20_001599 [Parelaphostrongylus tenuis]